MIVLQRTDYLNIDFRQLVVELDEELRERYPSDHDEHAVLNTMPANSCVIVAYEDSACTGCGCFRHTEEPGTVEVKRMFVRKIFRGRGISRIICGGIEEWAKELGVKRMILETGIKQPEAIRLYESIGFIRITNYGEYLNNDNSVCMEKILCE